MTETPASNVTEFSVSELANNLKRTIEQTYDHVRVRGELGRVTIARSGHMYADIKDDKAKIEIKDGKDTDEIEQPHFSILCYS